jgi:Icc-related predicted phosphoesterase
MTRRALRLDVRMRLNPVRAGRKLDILVTHAAPFGTAPGGDGAHAGFHAIARLIRSFHPLLAVHGHVHPYGRAAAEARLGATRVVNSVPSRLIEL